MGIEQSRAMSTAFGSDMPSSISKFGVDILWAISRNMAFQMAFEAGPARPGGYGIICNCGARWSHAVPCIMIETAAAEAGHWGGDISTRRRPGAEYWGDMTADARANARNMSEAATSVTLLSTSLLIGLVGKPQSGAVSLDVSNTTARVTLLG